MKRKPAIAGASLLLAAALCICGCRDERKTDRSATGADMGETVKSDAESLRDALEDKAETAATRVSEAVSRAGEKVSEGISDANEALEEGATKVSEAVSQAMETETDPG